MNSFDSASSLWDFSGSSDYNSLGQLGEEQFLDLLQKQFSQELPVTAFSLGAHDAAVDPAKLTELPVPNPPPPLSTDSSPSPSSVNEHSTVSRRQSTSFDQDESHKRKANEDDLDEGPSHKTSAKKNPARRKSGASQDENRLQKRKEQNRAAQRAFRERKEKHVRDLEEQVAALQAKNDASETENQHLRELLKRLQDENVLLKQAQFTFTVPKPSSETQPFANVATTSFGSAPNSAFSAGQSTNAATSPSTTGSTPPSSSLDTPSNFPSDIDFGTLTSFDPTQLSLLDENGDTTMSYDFGFGTGQVAPSNTPYKTIASNTMFMSFAEPSPPSDFPIGDNKASPPSGNNGSPFDSAFTNGWPGPSQRSEGSGVRTGSFDELFGGHMFGSQSPMSPASIQSLMNGSSSTISPILHARTSPTATVSSGSDASPGKEATMHGSGCPKTKEEFATHVAKSGSSPFAPSPPTAETILSGPGAVPALHKALSGDGAGPMIMCKGASFPPTEKREDNVEVLAAWRSITSHPHFKASNIDINELCAEFTDKARCDGTKIVLDKDGVNHIISRLTQKQGRLPARTERTIYLPVAVRSRTTPPPLSPSHDVVR
ncbi:hypothetical protein K488DRAFT_83235 [Vararia minispora EC-137]|uniref:Uncharacterized protein n=1 Tax=Vararia minispora EC-137 TaxID=1314806 RepID=A0ACB8QUU0_9AGAM|nr:hypothetical protein K488DRAFT_83235 [Vararia minispora EC-137]